MQLTLGTVHPVARTYDYVITRFDNGVKYGVWYGGKAPLNGPADNKGKYIGQVARRDASFFTAVEWFAAGANGSQDADKLQWHGPFKTRRDASIFLTGLTDGYSGAITEIAEG
jgi:hypothetical protein